VNTVTCFQDSRKFHVFKGFAEGVRTWVKSGINYLFYDAANAEKKKILTRAIVVTLFEKQEFFAILF